MISTSSSAAEPDHAAVNRVLADRVITPIYAQYQEAMRGLAPAIGDLCQTPNAATLDDAKAAYMLSIDAWQRLQPAAFGPIEAKGLEARIHFWPDKHGTAGKQLSRLLAKPDPAALEGGVTGKSAALQSLTALERVLFDETEIILAQDSAFACSLAVAIADFQEHLADDILESWQGEGGHLRLFTQASAGNDAYYDAADATTDLFGALAASLDGLIANKLEPPLGKSLARAKPKRAENWRSARSLPNIIANLETIKAVYVEPGGLHVFLSERGQDRLDQAIRQRLSQTLERARSIPLPLHDAVGDDVMRQQVESLLQEIKALRALFTGTLADAASLTVGFNKSDGD